MFVKIRVEVVFVVRVDALNLCIANLVCLGEEPVWQDDLRQNRILFEQPTVLPENIVRVLIGSTSIDDSKEVVEKGIDFLPAECWQVLPALNDIS